MKARTLMVVAGATLAISVMSEAAAQDTPPERRGVRATPSPEMIMSLRDRLELTDDQLAALEQLRAEGVDHRTQARAQMEEMRSRLRAGEIGRDEMRAFMQEMRASGPNAGDRRARIEGILTEDQLESLQETRTRRPGVRRMRDQARRGRAAMRGGRVAMRGRIAARGGRMGTLGERGLDRGGPGAWRGPRQEMRIRRQAMRAWRGEMRRGRR